MNIEIECPYCDKKYVHQLVHVKSIESPSVIKDLQSEIVVLKAEVEELKSGAPEQNPDVV